MKKCPFCAEDIQDAAIVCKHCGRDLPQPKTTTPPSQPQEPVTSELHAAPEAKPTGFRQPVGSHVGCPYCGKTITVGDTSCPYCARDLPTGVVGAKPVPTAKTNLIRLLCGALLILAGLGWAVAQHIGVGLLLAWAGFVVTLSGGSAVRYGGGLVLACLVAALGGALAPSCGAPARSSSPGATPASKSATLPPTQAAASAALTPEQQAAERKRREQEAEATREREAAAQGLRWQYDEHPEEMGRGIVKSAEVRSLNYVQFDFPYSGPQRGTLQLRVHPKYGKNVLLFVDKGQFLCGISRCRVAVRFDEGTAQNFTAGEPADHSTTYLFILDYDRFLASTRKAKKVYIEASFYQAATRVFEFDVSGLKW